MVEYNIITKVLLVTWKEEMNNLHLGADATPV